MGPPDELRAAERPTGSDDISGPRNEAGAAGFGMLQETEMPPGRLRQKGSGVVVSRRRHFVLPPLAPGLRLLAGWFNAEYSYDV
jgi:hypothetical protein